MLIKKETYDKLVQLKTGELDERGLELFNPKPLELRSGLKRPPSLKEQIQRVLRTELSIQASEQGQESFDEANDFDVKDDFEVEPPSKYELVEEEFVQPTEIAEEKPLPPTNKTPAGVEPTEQPVTPPDPAAESGK